MATIIICLILFVICIFGIRSTMKRIAYGCCGSGGDEVKRIRCKDPNPAHYPYHCMVAVDGMKCKNCARRVENVFHESENYFAKANLKENQVEIFLKQKTEEKELTDKIRKAGYLPGKVDWI